MKKRIYSALLIAICSLALPGCSLKVPLNTQKETESVQPETQPSNTPETNLTQTDAPQTDAPQTDAPQTDAPQTDAPQTDAPQTDAPQTDAPQTDAPQTDVPSSPQVTEPETLPVETEFSDTPSVSDGATLYIGSNGSFQEYHLDCGANASPEELIQGIADLTGWDLTLADSVYSGKGGMTVCFSSQCALFTGPPEIQKDEFHMYSVEQLVSTILDSIQATLQNYYIDPSLGDPSNLDIYYCTENLQPITLPDLGITIPSEEPYHGLQY